AFSNERFNAFVNEMPRFDLEEAIKQIRVPTLVIVGRHDPQAPLENSRRIAAAIPGARLVICEHSGHFPYVEEPAAFQAAIDQFMRESGLAETSGGTR
ncbi:MAG TPA: alpha/beta fold hydrolase, partial [Ktedonobacterales bacterium]|nr:alpha/beta fold hydrolase [Ktedonobacterales bacterium]